ncbi:SDR family oxidoreductase [Bacillus sp. FJAT-47783]|uniref:SDR family oxidoreductase n=1 Tax=Bacillus sp. FJAT-47783 TaxID=2922712 RepID=UPI001FACB6B0|nr:SDR family oxidoreductase [Bacillus sp. FJAT-47783]
MQKKHVLITGASSGFGMLTALHLAKKDYHVIATMRNIHKKNELLTRAKKDQVEKNITVHRLDVTSNPSLEELQTYLNKLGTLDILINNAGYADGGFFEDVSIEQYKKQFETNVFGLMAVTQIALPFIRKKKSGKIINISSISGLIGFPGLSPYVASKHALEGYTESLRLELKPFGIDVILIEPGSYETNIWKRVDTIVNYPQSEASPYHHYMMAILSELNREKLGDPADVARLITNLCEKKSVRKLRYPIGRGVNATLFLKKWIPWSVWESIVLKKLRMKSDS